VRVVEAVAGRAVPGNREFLARGDRLLVTILADDLGVGAAISANEVRESWSKRQAAPLFGL